MFRTELNPADPGFRIELNDPLITAGSCFSEVIGNRLLENKFNAMVNPFGTLFHPGILCQLLQMALEHKSPDKETYLHMDGLWLSYLLHSSINAPSPDILQAKLNTLFEEVNQKLRQAKVLLLTTGTAFKYHHEEMQLDVANCHKQAQKLFSKKLSSLEELHSDFSAFYRAVKEANPSIRIVLTVSPVRHLKDSLELNSVSKSLLRLFTHQASEQFVDVSYFPSYELLLDDLRDYRFYGRDLLHPSAEAEDYIWEKFTATYFSNNTHSFLKEWEKIRNALKHKPFNITSGAHQLFIRKTIQKLEHFPYPVNLENEIAQLKSQIHE